MASKYAIETIFKAIDSVTKPVQKMDKQMDKFGKTGMSVNSALKTGAVKVEKAFTKLNGVIKKVAITMGTAAAGAVSAFAVTGIKNAIEYEQSLAKLSTVADGFSMGNVSKEILAVSNATHVAASEITQATYDAITKGIDAANAVDFVATATKAAKASFTDTSTAIDGLTNVLNAYGMSADQATKIADQMLVTQNLGNTSFADLTNAMGQVAPLAASLNVKTEDLFASITALTAAGFKTPQAMKGIKTALNSVLKPSKDASELASQLGIDFSTAAIESKGWVGFLDDVAKKTGGNTEMLSRLFGNASGFNVLLTGGAGKLTEALDAMKNSAGATEKAFDRMMQTPQERIAGLKNQFTNAGIKLGQALIPVLEALADKVQIFVDLVDRSAEKIADGIKRVGGFISNLIQTIWNLRKVIAGIAIAYGVINGIIAAIKAWNVITEIATGIQIAYSVVVKGNQAATAALSFATEGATKATKIFSAILRAGGWIKATAGIIAQKVATLAMAAAQGVATAATSAWSAAVGVLNALFVASPIGWIVLAIGALIAIIVLCVKHWDEITAAVGFAWEKLKQFGSFIWDKLSPAFSFLSEMITNAAGVVKNIFLSAIDAVWQPIQRIIDAFTNGGIIGGIRQIGASILKFLLTPLLTMLNTLAKIPVVGEKIGAARDFITNAIDPLAYTTNNSDDENKKTVAPTPKAFTPYAAAQVNTSHTEINRSEMQISLERGLNAQVYGRAPGITVRTQRTGTFD